MPCPSNRATALPPGALPGPGPGPPPWSAATTVAAMTPTCWSPPTAGGSQAAAELAPDRCPCPPALVNCRTEGRELPVTGDATGDQPEPVAGADPWLLQCDRGRRKTGFRATGLTDARRRRAPTPARGVIENPREVIENPLERCDQWGPSPMVALAAHTCQYAAASPPGLVGSCLRGSSRHHDDGGASNLDLVAFFQSLGLVDAAPVEPGAVGRIEVLDVPEAMSELEKGVVA